MRLAFHLNDSGAGGGQSQASAVVGAERTRHSRSKRHCFIRVCLDAVGGFTARALEELALGDSVLTCHSVP